MFGKFPIRPAPELLWFSEDQGRDLVNLNCPNPPNWDVFYQREKAYYLQERTRYREVLGFWNTCSDTTRNAFVRCRSYSSRVPSAHPDYLVASNCSRSVSLYSFMDVKGPRESIRPGRRRFFPELVRGAGQSSCSHDGRLPKATFAALALLRVVS